MVCWSRPCSFKFFKGCHPQIFLVLFLNIFFHISFFNIIDFISDTIFLYQQTQSWTSFLSSLLNIYSNKRALLWLDFYLVGFFICVEISGMLKKKRLEKLVSPLKRSTSSTHLPSKILPGGVSLKSTEFLLYFYKK